MTDIPMYYLKSDDTIFSHNADYETDPQIFSAIAVIRISTKGNTVDSKKIIYYS